MGGERMVAAGLERVVRSEDMAVMGITEVVRHLPRIYREFRRLKQAIRDRRPDIAILIDFPDIHFKLAEEFHRLGVPVIFFVSPQLWAWKKHRIKLVRKYVDKMLVIFPFEEEFYRDRGVAAEFVGHPLAELPLPTITREQFAAENGLDPSRTWIGLLPGSRPKEIRDNLPEILKAARELAGQDEARGLEFLIPLADAECSPARTGKAAARNPRSPPACSSGRRCEGGALSRPRLGCSQRHGHRGSGPDRESLRCRLPGFASDLRHRQTGGYGAPRGHGQPDCRQESGS
jgi:lipid-A-disaccharide synthase